MAEFVIGFTKLKSTFFDSIKEAFKVRSRNKARKALAKARDNAIAKGETKVEEAATYGYKKVNRGFWVHLWRAIAGFGRMILRLTTLISGGATGLVTVPADVVITLMKLADKGFHKIKGFWKWVTGRRGKGRATNAGTLVNEE